MTSSGAKPIVSEIHILFIILSSNMTKQAKDRQALLASIYVFFIIVLSFYFGQFIMRTFGISIPGLRIAGGLIVAYIGFRMLFIAKKVHDGQNEESENIAGSKSSGRDDDLLDWLDRLDINKEEAPFA